MLLFSVSSLFFSVVFSLLHGSIHYGRDVQVTTKTIRIVPFSVTSLLHPSFPPPPSFPPCCSVNNLKVLIISIWAKPTNIPLPTPFLFTPVIAPPSLSLLGFYPLNFKPCPAKSGGSRGGVVGYRSVGRTAMLPEPWAHRPRGREGALWLPLLQGNRLTCSPRWWWLPHQFRPAL